MTSASPAAGGSPQPGDDRGMARRGLAAQRRLAQALDFLVAFADVESFCGQVAGVPTSYGAGGGALDRAAVRRSSTVQRQALAQRITMAAATADPRPQRHQQRQPLHPGPRDGRGRDLPLPAGRRLDPVAQGRRQGLDRVLALPGVAFAFASGEKIEQDVGRSSDSGPTRSPATASRRSTSGSRSRIPSSAASTRTPSSSARRPCSRGICSSPPRTSRARPTAPAARCARGRSTSCIAPSNGTRACGPTGSSTTSRRRPTRPAPRRCSTKAPPMILPDFVAGQVLTAADLTAVRDAIASMLGSADGTGMPRCRSPRARPRGSTAGPRSGWRSPAAAQRASTPAPSDWSRPAAPGQRPAQVFTTAEARLKEANGNTAVPTSSPFPIVRAWPTARCGISSMGPADMAIGGPALREISPGDARSPATWPRSPGPSPGPRPRPTAGSRPGGCPAAGGCAATRAAPSGARSRAAPPPDTFTAALDGLGLQLRRGAGGTGTAYKVNGIGGLAGKVAAALPGPPGGLSLPVVVRRTPRRACRSAAARPCQRRFRSRGGMPITRRSC